VPGRYVFHIASGAQVSLANVCTPYYFVSVAGSGQHPAGPDDVNASRETQAVYAGLTQYAPQSAASITYYQVPYQALPVSVLTANLGWPNNASDRFFNVNVPKYLESIGDGYSTLVGYLDSVHRTCAAQHITPKFFLVGYSQGALVIHKFLLNVNNSDPVKAEIAFVGLIADAGAVKGRSELVNYGTGSDSNDFGVCQVVWNTTHADLCGTANKDIPQAFQGKTESLCDRYDAVCDTSTDTSGDARTWAAKFISGGLLHTKYPDARRAELLSMGKSIGIINHMR
jgi:hypothetical protein